MGQLSQLQAALAEIVTKNRLREKVLIAPSFSSGHQIAEAVVKEGTPYLNLRIKTTSSLAYDMTALDFAVENISFLSRTSMLILLEDIFSGLKQKKRSYFTDIEVKAGIINAFAEAIYSLRTSGINSSDLRPGQFVSEQKGREIIELLRQYETLLEEKSYADYPKVLYRAIDKLMKKEAPQQDLLYLFVSDMPLSVLERKFIDLLPEDKIVLPHDAPRGLIYPRNYLTFSLTIKNIKPKSDIALMPWLFEPEEAPSAVKDLSVQMFHAVGRRNEVREVIRRLISLPATCDDAEIIYTSYDDYVPLIYETAVKFGIKTTLEEGIPVTFTRCGRAMLGLIAWVASNYEAIKFRQLLTGGCLNLQSAAVGNSIPSPAIMGRLVRESVIGWKRDRYLPVLKKMHALYAAGLPDGEENGEKKELHRIKATNAEFLADIIKDIFSFIPETDKDGLVSINGFCDGVIKFNNKYSRVSDELDAEAKSAINKLLEETAEFTDRKVTLQEALTRIEMLVREVRVGQSGPSHGSVHISSYKRGGRSGRNRTFILGCEANLFPGTPGQNPVLLDKEMQEINKDLMLSSDLLKENLYRMASLLSALKGNVTFSFSSFDVLRGRESFPSSLLLQVHRLITGDLTSDYSELIKTLGVPSGYVTGRDPMDSIDYWIQLFSGPQGLKKADAATIGLYPGLLEGIKASVARESDSFTEYDGKIISGKELDPRENQDIILSASRLEKFAKCPYSYFLKYVLRVRPLEEIKIEKGEWLDAIQRGSLLHDLFYRFMSELTAKKEKPSMHKHKALIEKLADDIIERVKEDIPPPGDAVFEQERKRILKSAEVFLRLEEAHCKSSDPILFEVPFGCMDEDTPVGLREPVEMDLENNKKIKIRGRIDRIDRVDKHEYVIWDYKTGSTYGYKDNEILSGGKVIQHALYAVAAEVILKKTGEDKKPVVRQSGYFFPTEKGTGRRFLKVRNDETVKELLKIIFDIMRSGAFIASAEKESCTYCDYISVCVPDVNRLAKTKISNDQNKELVAVNNMRSYG